MAFGRKKADDQLRVQLRGRLATTSRLADSEDLYSIFHSTAVYLGFDNGTLGLWGMNFAELTSQVQGLDVIAEFQVSPLVYSTEIVPQLLKCADISLMRIGNFELFEIEVTCVPGKAQNMTSRLSSSLGFFRALVPTKPVQALASLNWYSGARLKESDLAKLLSESNIEPFGIELISDPAIDSIDQNSFPSLGNATASVTLPDCSLDCVGWLVSFLISSLAFARAKDIIVLLELE